MNRLRLVARLRRLAMLQAEAELGRRLRAEREALQAEDRTRNTIEAEIRGEIPQAGADGFATWLAAARLGCERARQARGDAEHAVREARSALSAAEVAQAAIERLIGRRNEAARVLAARRDQVAIDDLAARGPR